MTLFVGQKRFTKLANRSRDCCSRGIRVEAPKDSKLMTGCLGPLYADNIHTEAPSLRSPATLRQKTNPQFFVQNFFQRFFRLVHTRRRRYRVEGIKTLLVASSSSWRLRLEPADIALPNHPLAAELDGWEPLLADQLEDRLPRHTSDSGGFRDRNVIGEISHWIIR